MARRKPNRYNWARLQFDERLLKKHVTAPRRGTIQFVVVHHSTIVGHGNGSANDTMWQVWQNREASAHYGVDGDHVMQFVWDRNAAWATGNATGNHHGISIEHANSTREPAWRIDDLTWKTGARLVAHLHHAHRLGRPTSTGSGRGGTLRKHSSFTSTACPGPYMDAIWPKYVAEAQRAYDSITNGTTPGKDWFDMATEKELRKIIREELASTNNDIDWLKQRIGGSVKSSPSLTDAWRGLRDRVSGK